MRPCWGMLLGIALGAEANRLDVRQAASNTAPASQTPSSGSSAGGGGGGSSATGGASSVSTPVVTSPAAGGDTTIFVTQTVTNGGGGGSVVTQVTTVQTNVIVTITQTTTDFSTTTVTSRDADVATKVIFSTVTQTINAKRDLSSEFHVIGRSPVQVGAQPTPSAEAGAWWAELSGLERARNYEKRAIITNTVLVTVGGTAGASTVLSTVIQTVRTTTTAVARTVSILTETEQANARSTITTTSVITVRQTQVSNGAVETASGTPGDSSGGGGGSSSDGGLSGGAKAGIGIGVGLAGLALIAIVLWFCLRRRRGPKPNPDDLLGPSSEVPVGFAAGGSRNSRPMSEALTSTPGTAPRRSPVVPNVQPEGYRGTAMGDGRAGYAKPEPYGAGHAPTRSTTTNTKPSTLSPEDQLPRHPTPEGGATSVSPVSPYSNTRPQTAELGNDGAAAKWHNAGAAEMATDSPAAAKWHSDNAHEIDSRPAMGHQSGPVYEMP
ncbi:hypothetical protein AAL_06068 [Moelleriella libera RCEF 2490]|uniref:Uncharacterized protein n=1 Tax=Moelleriella libera RCEF 2490 TaxID=1081109 RepID=A0A167ZBM9_9HYPO|nr:hypothetical protein AAL_06068 [Moelleriella libera RCEF 2490]